MGSSNSTSRMDLDDPELQSNRSDESSEELEQETDLATILQYLIRSGQVQIISSTYEDDLYLSSQIPKIKHKPNTAFLDKSEFALQTKQASGLSVGMKHKSRSSNIASMIVNRERGMYTYRTFSNRDRCKLGNRYLPNEMKTLFDYGGKAFCGVYSQNGEYFISACQDRQIRLYRADKGTLKPINQIQARDVGWSVIDVAFSPDCSKFVYSSWSSALHLCSIDGDSDNQETLNLSPNDRRFCIFSVQFSADGRDVLGGANDGCLYVYDRECNQQSLRIPAHDYDVNTVAFADSTSQILYSGGDDGLAKVWDRRTLSEASPKPVGILAGHMDGITFIDSRGDGRHLISNSKDQSIKLWDVRVFSGSEGQNNTKKAVQDQTWDYRWQEVPRRLYNPKQKLEGDTSIMTYRGHSVLKTLVRCRFSPAVTTGQRYIYTGCGIGRVVIYDALTGKIKRDLQGHSACVRDVSWHPFKQEIISSSWDKTLGHWSYSGKEALDSDNDEADDSVFLGESRRKQTPLRRSIRLAQKKEREELERQRQGRTTRYSAQGGCSNS